MAGGGFYVFCVEESGACGDGVGAGGEYRFGVLRVNPADIATSGARHSRLAAAIVCKSHRGASDFVCEGNTAPNAQ